MLSSSADLAVKVSRAVKAGQLRSIGPKLYTSNLKDDDETVIRRNLWRVVGLLSPGSVVSYRTALEGKPSANNTVYLVGGSDYRRDLPGLHLRVEKGPGPQEGDLPFIGGLYMASRPRALLEALKPSRKRAGTQRGLTPTEIEAIVEGLFDAGGERKLNEIRDRAAALVPALDAQAENQTLSRLIGVLLGSRQGPLTQASAIARLAGTPYDSARLELFQKLFAHLQATPSASRVASHTSSDYWVNTSFFDAYFSNFIEGTEFEVDEAREIVFENKIPADRPLDAHDVLGTWHVVGNRATMSQSIMKDVDETAFIERLRTVHHTILEGRTDKRPGQFKQLPNRAGDTRFVEPDKVRGTLHQGFQLARGLAEPFHRATALMFIISEVHPFDDGNGRVARALMNAELITGGEARILIPSVFREEYLSGLRNLTRQYEPKVLVQVMDYAQRFTSSIDWSNYDRARAMLENANAFEKPAPDMKLQIPAVKPDLRR